ncbi:MAG: hydrogenase, partial [Planctomycetota bacterium]
AVALSIGLDVIRGGWFGDGLLSLVAMGLLGVTIGAIESSMARLRLYRVPQFLVGAGAMSALAFVLVMK